MPHAVPICFALVSDRLYSVVDNKPKRRPTELKRLRNITENPRAAVVVDHYDDDWRRLAYVMLRGKAVIVEDPAEYREGLEALRAKYPQYQQMVLEQAANPMLCLRIERINYWAAASAAG